MELSKTVAAVKGIQLVGHRVLKPGWTISPVSPLRGVDLNHGPPMYQIGTLTRLSYRAM
jgi:hypothetical protein